MKAALEIVLKLAEREAKKRQEELPAGYAVEHLRSVNEPQSAVIYGERAAVLYEAAEAIRQALVDERGPGLRSGGTDD